MKNGSGAGAAGRSGKRPGEGKGRGHAQACRKWKMPPISEVHGDGPAAEYVEGELDEFVFYAGDCRAR